jgi:hypothetical protein
VLLEREPEGDDGCWHRLPWRRWRRFSPAGANAERALASLDLLSTVAGGAAAVSRVREAPWPLRCSRRADRQGNARARTECAIVVLADSAAPPPVDVVGGRERCSGIAARGGRRTGSQLLRYATSVVRPESRPWTAALPLADAHVLWSGCRAGASSAARCRAGLPCLLSPTSAQFLGWGVQHADAEVFGKPEHLGRQLR